MSEDPGHGLVKTRLLYEEAPQARIFQTKVLKAERVYGERVYIVLSETCFSIDDCGVIRTPEGIIKIDKTEVDANGVVWHYGSSDPSISMPQPGSLVEGEVDWDRRVRIVRNHMGTHVIKGAIIEVLGAELTTRVDVNTDVATITVQYEGKSIDWDVLQRLEHTANKAGLEGYPVTEKFMSRLDAEKEYGRLIYDLFPVPEHVKTLKVLEIRNLQGEIWEVNACQHIHPRRIADILPIRLVEARKVRKDRWAFKLRIGEPAVRLIQEQANLLHDIRGLLKVSRQEDLLDHLKKILTDYDALCSQLKEMMKQMITIRAKNLISEAEIVGSFKVITQQQVGLEVPDLRELATLITDQESNAVVFLVSPNDKIYFVAVAGAKVVEKGLNMNEIIKKIAPILNGKGGGSPSLAQGAGQDKTRIPEAIKLARTMLIEKLGT